MSESQWVSEVARRAVLQASKTGAIIGFWDHNGGIHHERNSGRKSGDYYRVEALLEEHAKELGAEIRLGHKVIGLHQDKHGFQV